MAKKKKKHRRSRKARSLSFSTPVPITVRTQVEALLEEDSPGEALDILEEWLEKRPDHPILSFYAGCAHAILGEPRPALRYFRTAYRTDRRNESLLSNLMGVYLELGFTTHALRVLRNFLKTELILEQGNLEVMTALRRDLERHQREAASRFGFDIDRFEEGYYWDEECQIAQHDGDWNGSLSAANKALSYLPDYPPALNWRPGIRVCWPPPAGSSGTAPKRCPGSTC